MSDWTATVDALIDHVNLLKELGERSVEIDPVVMAALGASVKTAPAPVPASVVRQSSVPRPQTLATAPAVSSALSPEARRGALAEIEVRVEACTECVLRQNRTRSVPGQGNADGPDVMFIGEAPGYDEDQQGLAFVGAAGQLLTKMVAAMGYTRDEVFIANICKCRPPGNRAPLPEEMQKCLPFLREQIRLIRPKTIVLLGGTAIKGLLDTQVGVNRIQGHWTQYDGIPVMPTFHPSYLLRFEPAKRDAWHALKLVLAHLGKPVPGTPKK